MRTSPLFKALGGSALYSTPKPGITYEKLSCDACHYETPFCETLAEAQAEHAAHECKRADPLAHATDHQLRDEINRRWPGITAVTLRSSSNDELRGECKRRALPGPVDEVEELKSKLATAEAWCRDRNEYVVKAQRAAEDRDYLRKALNEVDEVIMRHTGDAQYHRADWLRERLERAQASDERPRMTVTIPMSEALVRATESGPGIASTKPDTSHWVDPWEFMEDA